MYVCVVILTPDIVHVTKLFKYNLLHVSQKIWCKNHASCNHAFNLQNVKSLIDLVISIKTKDKVLVLVSTCSIIYRFHNKALVTIVVAKRVLSICESRDVSSDESCVP